MQYASPSFRHSGPPQNSYWTTGRRGVKWSAMKTSHLTMLLLLSACQANAAIIANITLAGMPSQEPTTGATCCYFRQDFSDYYTLTATGGTGQGYAVLDVLLSTTSDEANFGTPPPYTFSTDAQIFVDGLNNSSWWAPNGTGCLMGPQCVPFIAIPFTFGIPETIHVSGYVDAQLSAEFGTDLSSIAPYAPYIGASVNIRGISEIYSTPGGPQVIPGAQATLVPEAVPEPAVFWLVGIGVLIMALSFRRLVPIVLAGPQ